MTKFHPRGLCLVLLFFCSSVLFAQDKETSNSTEIIRKAFALHEEEKYDEAIAEFQKVHRNDSNYYIASVEALGSMLGAKRYKEGLELCDHLLKLQNDYTPNILVFKGDFLDYLGRHDEAHKIFEQGREKYPRYNLFYYEAGVARLLEKNYNAAFDLFVKSVQVNPFHAASHHQLALLAFRNNNLTASMLAFQFYLVVDPSSKKSKTIVTDLERISKLELEPDTILPVKLLKQENDFSEIESVLRSKFAMSSKFKTRTRLEYDMLKQMQVLIENIGKYADVKGFYNDFYGRFFAELNKAGHIEAFMYHTLKGMELEKVNKWIAKNKSDVDRFEIWGYNYICSQLARTPENLNGKTETVPHWYADNQIVAAGKKNDNEQNQGYWNYYYRNGIKKAEGEFVNANKTGLWRYYEATGDISEEVEYENGAQKVYRSFYTTNNPKVEAPIANDQVHGEKKIYYSNGNLYSVTPFKQGKISGKQTYYHRNGTLRYSINNENDVISGDLVEYFDNGKKYQTATFTEGNREGFSKTFYNNKDNTLETEGSYIRNKPVGVWKYYHPNGKLKKQQTYNNNGELEGESTEYFENGKTETVEYYSNNKINGTSKMYSDDGVLWQEYVHKKGKLMEYRAYRKNGEKICDNKINGKNFSVVLYHPNGIKRREGKVSDGELEGPWKDYNSYGVLFREANYKEGQYDGKYTEYYANGKVHIERHYTAGNENGTYRAFYKNGQLQTEGEIVNNNNTGYWKTWYRDGTLSGKVYYTENELDGWNEYYDVKGRIHNEDLYRESCLVKLVYHDTTGAVSQNIDLPGGTGTIEKKTMAGDVVYVKHFVKDYPEGVTHTFFPGKKQESKVEYQKGRKEGRYLEYNVLGTLVNDISFFNNNKNGAEKVYDDYGKIQTNYNYEDGNFHGECFSYFENGKVYRKVNYLRGDVEGESDLYDNTGELMLKRYFHNDLMVGYSYLDTKGELLPARQLETGDSKIVGFYRNGKKSIETTYTNGDLNGKRTMYYANGNLMDETGFYYDSQHGESKSWFSNGKLKSRAQFDYGQEQGLSENFYETGKKRSEKMYVNGELHGWSRYYDPNGKIIQSVFYYNGLPIQVQ